MYIFNSETAISETAVSDAKIHFFLFSAIFSWDFNEKAAIQLGQAAKDLQ
jgi:hypothetical protein